MEVIMARAWFPFYVGDFLRDTMDLSPMEKGCYVLLLCHYYSVGSLPNGSPFGIPTNDLKLANIAQVPLETWQAMAPAIAAKFLPGWIQKRAEEELVKQDDVSKKRRVASARGNNRKAAIAAARKHLVSQLGSQMGTQVGTHLGTQVLHNHNHIKKKSPTVLPRAREPAEPNTPVPPPPDEDPMTVPLTKIARRMSEKQSGAPVPQTEDPMKIPLSEIARRMSEQQSLQTQQTRKEAAADGSTALESISQMQASEIAELAAAKREADEALAEAKRRKLNGGHEPAPAAARSA
jgi:uncharacterized protein YdaU (DUF1376 family)